MKLINITMCRHVFSEDIEIVVYFLRWKVAAFKLDPLTNNITRK